MADEDRERKRAVESFMFALCVIIICAYITFLLVSFMYIVPDHMLGPVEQKAADAVHDVVAGAIQPAATATP